MKLDGTVVRDILKAVVDNEDDLPILNLKEVFGISPSTVNDEGDRCLLKKADAHLLLLVEGGLIEATQCRDMPPGGWRRDGPEGPLVPYEYIARLGPVYTNRKASAIRANRTKAQYITSSLSKRV